MSGAAGGGGGAGAAVRHGHLRKLKTMKKKFFVLRAEIPEAGARLEYYESEKKWRAGAAPRRVLPLDKCYNITRRLDLKQKHVIALFTSDEQFCLVADSEAELHAWHASLLRLYRPKGNPEDDLLHPIQHVWQVNVQKKGLGAVRNIHGLYNLCLTDKTLSLVKIKTHNNIISELAIPERVEYALKNIRRCGDSECFFYMEVGRQTSTGAGELWMHSEDSNIAQSMHSTILHAMRNCTNENERDHIVIPKNESGLPARRQTYSDGRGRAGLTSDAGTLRNRCDSMPSRACSSFESERPPPRHNDLEGTYYTGSEVSRDETDSAAEWCRTPRIPEEPDVCDIHREILNMSIRGGGSYQHSRTSSLGVEDPDVDGYLSMVPHETPDGYLPMAPVEPLGGLVSASSGSVCSGTPSTDPRFSEYQLEPATMHICETRPPRAYSVGSRPAPRAEARHRAYSVGARARPAPPAHPPRAPASHDDLMLLDFTPHSKQSTPTATPGASLGRTPPAAADEYVDMSPRNAGYVEMKPGGVGGGSDDERWRHLATVREAGEDAPHARALNTITRESRGIDIVLPPAERSGRVVSCSPQYVTLKPGEDLPPAPLARLHSDPDDSKGEWPAGAGAAVVVSGACAGAARLAGGAPPSPACAPLNYAALDLEPRRAQQAPAARTYTQIDFVRSEKLHAADAT